MSDFAVSSGLQNFTKNSLKDSADAFHAWSQWAQGNLTFKEASKYSGGNRDGREERLKIASRQGIRDAEKARGNRTYTSLKESTQSLPSIHKAFCKSYALLFM